MNPDNIQAALKDNLEAVLSSTLDPSTIAGIEAYAAKEALAQYNAGKKDIFISKVFGDVTIEAKGSVDTGIIDFNIINGSSKN